MENIIFVEGDIKQINIIKVAIFCVAYYISFNEYIILQMAPWAT